MSYAVYKTEALIIRIVPQSEANRDIVVFTKEFGKITVRARSARKIESTMRMHITRYNYVVIDMVRGKNSWILTGIHQVERRDVFKTGSFLHGWYRTITLAEHLIRGEEAHPDLFDFFITLYHLAGNEYGAGIELFGVIHVLDMLGYWHGQPLDKHPTPELLDELLAHKKQLVKMINESIEATQIVV